MANRSFSLNLVHIIFLLIFSFISFRLFIHGEPVSFPEKSVLNIYEGGDILTQKINLYSSSYTDDDQFDKVLMPFPYLLSGLIKISGKNDFNSWVQIWELVCFAFYVCIGLVLLKPLSKANLILALIVMVFWLFNRWSVNALINYDVNILTLFFVLYSLILLKPRKIMPYIIFGIAISINLFSLVLLPVYLIYFLKNTPNLTIPKLFKPIILIIIVPALCSIFFIITDFSGFFSAIFSSSSIIHAGDLPLSLNAFLGLSGFSAKLPLIIVIAGIYLLLLFDYIQKNVAFLILVLAKLSLSYSLGLDLFPWLIAAVSLVIAGIVSNNNRQNEYLR